MIAIFSVPRGSASSATPAEPWTVRPATRSGQDVAGQPARPGAARPDRRSPDTGCPWSTGGASVPRARGRAQRTLQPPVRRSPSISLRAPAWRCPTRLLTSSSPVTTSTSSAGWVEPRRLPEHLGQPLQGRPRAEHFGLLARDPPAQRASVPGAAAEIPGWAARHKKIIPRGQPGQRPAHQLNPQSSLFGQFGRPVVLGCLHQDGVERPSIGGMPTASNRSCCCGFRHLATIGHAKYLGVRNA